MRWTLISSFKHFPCCTESCDRTAIWRGESGSVGSDFCPSCRDAVDLQDLRDAATAVVRFDWSDNDADAVSAIDRLRQALSN
jgi:hypothetical protein